MENTINKELTITRVINAPRELVWKAWSDANNLAQWWGPKGFTMCDSKLDFRPGGNYHYGMKSPDGNMLWGLFKYLEITEPGKIVFINCFSDKEGGITRAPFNPNWPLEVKNILSLEEHEGKTTLTLRAAPVNATALEHKAFNEMYSGMEQGFGATFSQLEAYLAKNQQVEII